MLLQSIKILTSPLYLGVNFSLNLPVHVSTATGENPEYTWLMLYNKGGFLFTFKAANLEIEKFH